PDELQRLVDLILDVAAQGVPGYDSRKLAARIRRCVACRMIRRIQPVQAPHALAEHDVSWLAIRYPAVLRLVERELAGADGGALAAGLELACRALGRAPLGDLRLDHNTLSGCMVAVRSGRCDRAMVRAIRAQIDELQVVLTQREQDAVATVIAAILWAVF